MFSLLCLGYCLAQPEPGDYFQIPVIPLASLETIIAAGSDHGSIVSAQPGRGDEHREWRLLGNYLTQPAVGSHSTGQQDEFSALFEGGSNGFCHQHINYRFLKTSGQIGHVIWPATLRHV